MEKMGHVYPELRHNQEMVRSIINLEEKKVGEALSSGLNWLDKVMEAAGSAEEDTRRGCLHAVRHVRFPQRAHG